MDYRYTKRQIWRFPIIALCGGLVIWGSVTIPKVTPSDPKAWLASGVTLTVLLVCLAFFLVLPHVRRMKKTVLRLSEDALEFPEGPMARTLKFTTIELVTERRSRGILKSIPIHVNGGFLVELKGFEDMEGIIRELRQKLPAERIRIL